jgi:hypothetical protein
MTPSSFKTPLDDVVTEQTNKFSLEAAKDFPFRDVVDDLSDTDAA